VLIYPGGVLDRQDKEKLSAQMRITKETPPTFLAVSSDDKGSVAGTMKLFQGMREAGVSAELHVFATGGHGWGMRKSDQTFGGWTARCEEWMRARGLFKAAAPAGGK
jgi:acetyl esterase/lipase